MAESSSYRDSINFYERVSHLQGELKNYESQQFQLEGEFQRLWTQGVSLPSSHEDSNNTTFSPSAHIAQSGHLTTTSTKSQLLANPSNLNYYGKIDEVDRRLARNQAILDKLQELETNASIFAARSERLRMMRDEYETLVRKNVFHRKWTNSEVCSLHCHGQSFSSNNQSGSESLTSIGINTDITGPIRSLSISMSGPDNSANIEASNIMSINPNMDSQVPKLHSTPIGQKEKNSNDFLYEDDDDDDDDTFTTKQTIRRPTFLDISSTSESEFLESKLKEHQQDNLDETSADTTSLSVLMPKSRRSNYMPNVSTDGSLSDSTSIKQLPISKTISLKNFNPITNSSATITTTTSTTTTQENGTNKRNGKELIYSISEAVDKYLTHPDEECSSTTDSTSNSVRDSVMDSVQNKTPDSLPKDDSELLHITEAEEEDEDSNNLLHKNEPNYLWGENNEPTKLKSTTTMLINDMEKQNQETLDNSSSSKLLRVAQKEIQISNFGEESNVHTVHDHNEEMDFVNELDLKGQEVKQTSNFVGKGNVSLISDPGQSTIQIDDLGNNIRAKPFSVRPRTSFVDPVTLYSHYKNGKSAAVKGEVTEPTRLYGESVKDDPQEKHSSDYKSNKESVEQYVKPKTTQEDFSSRRKDFNSDARNQVSVTSSSLQPTEKSIMKPMTAGNVSKKGRLKLDYDDSESETSDAAIMPVSENNKQIISKDLKLNDKDDDFDDFYV